MYAPRKTIAVVGLVAALAVGVGLASAEPKNQWPFARQATEARALAQSARQSGDVSPRPEPKNQLPFTRTVGDARAVAQTVLRTRVGDVSPRSEPKNEPPFTRIVAGAGNGSQMTPLTISSRGSSWIDWTLVAWCSLVAITLVGGAFTLRHRKTAWAG